MLTATRLLTATRRLSLALAWSLACIALLGAPGAAFAQADGTYRIVTVGNTSLWWEDGKDTKMVTGANPAPDEDSSRFVLAKQADGSFRITTKANGRHLHVDGGAGSDNLLSTRFQPNDDFTRFVFEEQKDLSYRIKVKASGRYLRDAGKPDGGALGTVEQKDDNFSRFLLFDPDSKQHEKWKVTFKSSRTKDSEVFRITRHGDEVRHETGVIVKAGKEETVELPTGFRWVVRDVDSKQELSRFVSVSTKSETIAVKDSQAPPPPSRSTLTVKNLRDSAVELFSITSITKGKEESVGTIAPAKDAKVVTDIGTEFVVRDGRRPFGGGQAKELMRFKIAKVTETIDVPKDTMPILTVINNRVYKIDLFSITDGKEKSLKTIAAESSAKFDVTTGQEYLVRDDQGKELKRFKITKLTEVIEVLKSDVMATLTINNQRGSPVVVCGGLPGRRRTNFGTIAAGGTAKVEILVDSEVEVFDGTEKVKSLRVAKTETISIDVKNVPHITVVEGMVPDLKNLFKVDAALALRAVSLKAKAIPGDRTTEDAKLGVVYSQTQSPGQKLAKDSTVEFKYFTKQMPRGVTTTRVNWVINRSIWDAEKWILRSGLEPEGVEADDAPNPGREFTVHGFDDDQNPKGDVTVALGTKVTFRHYKGKSATTPIEAHYADPIPNVIAYANTDGSIDVAWTRKDTRSFYSTYSGSDFTTAKHLELKNALRYLAGFTKDDSGNAYIATMRGEYARQEDWDAGYRPHVAHLLRLRPGASEAEMFIDLNTKEYTSTPIMNPLNYDSAAYDTSRMVYGNGMLALTFALNFAGNAQSAHSKSYPIVFTTDRKPLYTGGGSQHCEDLSLMFDGQDFVMSQAFEGGVGLSKLERRSDGSVTFSDQVLGLASIATHIPGQQHFTRVGGVVKTPRGYLHVAVHQKGKSGNYGPNEWMPNDPTPVSLGFAPFDFQTKTKFDFTRTPKLQSEMTVTMLREPGSGFNFVRPRILDLRNNTYLVLWEQRFADSQRREQYDTTQAVLIDESGKTLRGPVRLENARMQMCNDPIYLPKTKQAAWVCGDGPNKKIMLHTLSASLELKSYTLAVP